MKAIPLDRFSEPEVMQFKSEPRSRDAPGRTSSCSSRTWKIRFFGQYLSDSIEFLPTVNKTIKFIIHRI
jgi:hypothetical protein